MKEQFVLTGALLIILVGTGMAILAQLPGAGPKLTRTTQVTPEEAKAAQQKVKETYVDYVEEPFNVRRMNTVIEQGKAVERSMIIENNPTLPAHPCEWIYQETLGYAMSYDHPDVVNFPKAKQLPQAVKIQVSLMWSQLYLACKERLR